jgi:hypothetical protein
MNCVRNLAYPISGMRLLFLVLLISVLAVAQTDRGAITGTVSDPANAVVPRANILVTNANTGAQYEAVTTGTGNYTAPALPVGVYNLSVSAAGFSKYIQQGIRIDTDQTVRVDVILQVGSATESVTVNADAQLLKTESVEQSGSLTNDRLDALPQFATNLRTPFNFVFLIPGVQAGTSLWIPQQAGSALKINGAPSLTYRVLMDGQDFSSTYADPSHSLEAQPNVDSLQESTLETSNFAAEFGQIAGGLFNFTTKSGTNSFHGAVFEYERNELLDAGQPYTNDGNGHHVKARHRGDNYGGSVGGPVWIPKIYNGKDKTFFFFSYEKYDQTLITNTYQTVPTTLMQAGNFSQAFTGRNLGTDPTGAAIMENTVYDPLTNQTVNGSVTRTPFPGNIIPTSRLDPVALKIQSFFPAPTNNLVLLNWLQIAPAPDHRNVPSIKIDQYFGPKSKLSFYFSRYRYDAETGQDALPVPITHAHNRDIQAKTFRLNYDYTLSPTVLIHAGFGYLRPVHYDGDIPAVYNYNAATGLGLVGSYTNGMPSFGGLSSTTGGGMGLGFGVNAQNENINDKPTAVLNATWVHGNHTYKIGAQWRRDENIVHSYAAVSSWTFSANETALPYLQTTNIGGGSIGLPYASFLLGLGDSASQPSLPDPFYRKTSWGFYLQDTWKITRKMTLDYGLRYDYQHAPEEVNYRDSMFGPTIPNPTAGGLLGGQVYEGYGAGRCNCQFTTPYPYAIGPRLGLAYQFAPKMVLRMGWGIVYGITPDGGQSVANGVGWNTLSFTTPSFGTAAATLRQGLVYDPASLFSVTLNPGMFPTAGQVNSPAYYLDRNGGRPPRFNQWNISVQRQVTENIVVEAAYVGNRGIWLESNSGWDLNALSPSRISSFGLNINNSADLTLLNSPLNSTLAASRGFSKLPYAGFPTTLTVAQSLRPYPQFGSIFESWAPLGNSWYDALQAKFSKRMSHGFGATGAFTWSKSLQLGADTNTGGGIFNDQFNRPNNKEFASLDQPLILVISFNYRIPKLGPNRYVRAVTGGWTLSGTDDYGSGSLIASPTAQNNLSTILFRNTLFTRVPGVPLYLTNINGPIDANKQFVLNPAAWSEPAAGQWGYAAPYYSDYRGRRLPNEQASLGRLFPLREGITLEFRVEFTNIFNRRVWNSPSSSNPLATQTYNGSGVPSSGFGYIANTAPPIANWRNGQALIRLQF